MTKIIKKQLLYLSSEDKDKLILGLLGIVTLRDDFYDHLTQVKLNLNFATPDAQPCIRAALDFIDKGIDETIKKYAEGN